MAIAIPTTRTHGPYQCILSSGCHDSHRTSHATPVLRSSTPDTGRWLDPSCSTPTPCSLAVHDLCVRTVPTNRSIRDARELSTPNRSLLPLVLMVLRMPPGLTADASLCPIWSRVHPSRHVSHTSILSHSSMTYRPPRGTSPLAWSVPAL